MPSAACPSGRMPALPAGCHEPTPAPWLSESPQCHHSPPVCLSSSAVTSSTQGATTSPFTHLHHSAHTTLSDPCTASSSCRIPFLKPMPQATSNYRERQSPHNPQSSLNPVFRREADEQLWVGWKGSPLNPVQQQEFVWPGAWDATQEWFALEFWFVCFLVCPARQVISPDQGREVAGKDVGGFLRRKDFLSRWVCDNGGKRKPTPLLKYVQRLNFIFCHQKFSFQWGMQKKKCVCGGVKV